MALPIDVTDPGSQQIPTTNAETQAFGLGLATQIAAAVSTPSSLPSWSTLNVENPGSSNAVDQAFGSGLALNVNVG